LRLVASKHREDRKEDQGESPIGHTHIHNLYMRRDGKRRRTGTRFLTFAGSPGK
jgi:hypothetical protein